MMGTKFELHDEFNADIQLNAKKNPREYVQSLMVIAEKLGRRCNIIKSEEDIIHQVLKVVGSRYKEVVGPLKTEMHRGKTISLSEVMNVLGARHKEIQRERKTKSGKKKVRIYSDSSSTGSNEEDD